MLNVVCLLCSLVNNAGVKHTGLQKSKCLETGPEKFPARMLLRHAGIPVRDYFICKEIAGRRTTYRIPSINARANTLATRRRISSLLESRIGLRFIRSPYSSSCHLTIKYTQQIQVILDIAEVILQYPYDHLSCPQQTGLRHASRPDLGLRLVVGQPSVHKKIVHQHMQSVNFGMPRLQPMSNVLRRMHRAARRGFGCT